ncbi:MAG: glycoside hydrolase family 43 protein [Woeseiaceae bacterium]
MSGRKISNPILRGFNPDPSICRVDEDYYIAVSTFEWYPGVQIFHSRDLENWALVARPLNREALLDLRGEPDSCGVWAPCLSYADGKFWLCYTDVKRFDGNFKDTHNYLTTCESIDGEWSDPVYMNSSGFDPSLFHDDDGRKWYTNAVWDHRPDRSFFLGIEMREYDAENRRLSGEPSMIFSGTEIDFTEAPHLYRRGEYYYLMTAEGGTGYGHCVTIARSGNVWGPYEADPDGPVITARYDPELPLQRTGHGDFVETPDGDVYLVYLCGRPLPNTRLCPLGRETAIQKVIWTEDGWLRPASGGHLPELQTDAPDLKSDGNLGVTSYDDFASDRLDDVYQWLRTPYPEAFYSLSDRPGFLRLYGMESPGSLFNQALIARRQTDFVFQASTAVDFLPTGFQQMAGLTCYYNSRKFHYLYVSTDDDIGRHLGIMSCEADPTLAATFPMQDARIVLPAEGRIWLRADVDFVELRFSWSADGENWQLIPVMLDQSLLSDEAGLEFGEQFTGAFVGVTCNDVSGRRQHADFEFFSYCGMDSEDTRD